MPRVIFDSFCNKCNRSMSACVCDKTIGESIDIEAKTEEQEFIETLKTLKGWEWELVAKHIPFSLCLERVNKEIARLQEFEYTVKYAVKESEG